MAGQSSPFNEEYVRRLTERDADVERHFVEYFAAPLRIKLHARIRYAQDAADLLQEVYLRVFRSLRQGTGLHHPERLGAYVNKVCENVILEHYRLSKRAVQLDEGVLCLRSPEKGAEAEIISAEALRHVRAVLAALSARDRRVLQAVFLEERAREAVCREFGIRPDHLRVLLHRAKIRLRELLTAVPANAA